MPKPKILIVDDEERIRFAVRDFFELQDYDVVVARRDDALDIAVGPVIDQRVVGAPEQIGRRQRRHLRRFGERDDHRRHVVEGREAVADEQDPSRSRSEVNRLDRRGLARGRDASRRYEN